MPRHALLIYNPIAGRRRQRRVLSAIAAALRGSGVVAEAVATRSPGDATTLARQAAAEGGWDLLLALGGDGTVRETAVGALGTDLPLGILPSGTVNVLARLLSIPLEPLAAARVVAAAAPRPFDVGLCGATPFLMMASTGLDAAVMEAVDPRRKALLGRGAVVLVGLRRWWSYGYPLLEVEADGRELHGSFAAVSNIPLYGGPYRLAPAARFDDRRLDLSLFRGRGRAATLGFAWSLVRGTHVHRADVEIAPVERVVLRGPAGLPVQIDGDTCPERLPVPVTLAPDPVQILAPSP